MAVVSGLSVSTDRSAARSPLALSLPLVLGVVMFVCLANAGGLPLLGDPDSQWHIGVGNWMLAHRTVPDVDTFSFTFAGQPWIAKEWLSQLLLTLAYNAAGWAGVEALAAAALAAGFALLLRLLLRDLWPLPALLFVGAAVVMMAPHFLARPHALAFPFMLLWVAGLVRAVEARRAPEPLLLGAMLLWANMHGGFTLGLLLAAAFALDALVGARDGGKRKALFIGWTKFGIGALLVACITPYGYESILVTSRIFSLGDALNAIAEWRSPDFKAQPMQEIVLLVHLYLGYARNAELLATLAPLAIAPLLARQFPALARDRESVARLEQWARPAGAGAMALGVLVAAVFAGAVMRFGDVKPPGATMPSDALAFARKEGLASRHVFNHYNFGGYLIGQGV